jgi:hypothetical protein
MTLDHPGPGRTQEHYLATLHAGGETGLWDEHGPPAPGPDDLDEWRPATGEPLTTEPGQQPL